MKLAMVLCPVDFSAATAPLLAYAAPLARAGNAIIQLLHVIEGQLTAWQPQRETTAETRLQALAASPELAGLTIQTKVRFGNPEQTIVSYASDHHADLIVIGAHGATGLTRFLMGGTAEGVMRMAPCPTILVSIRPDEAAAAQAA
jgi:nucleotide-binding universal stress UspA family protein